VAVQMWSDKFCCQMSATISKTTIPALKNRRLSPGSIHGCRIAICTEDSFVIANDADLYVVQAKLQSQNNILKNEKYVTTVVPCTESPILQQAQHQTEIQNIFMTATSLPHNTADSKFLYSIDQTGFCSVYLVSSNDVAPVWTITPPSTNRVELGWAGVSASHLSPMNSATARFFDKRICYYDKERLIREFFVVQHPTQIAFLPERDIIAVTEYNQVSFWDYRQGERSGCIKRLMPSSEPLYALTCTENLIAVGGASSTLTVFDTRKWALRTHWKNCLKYEVRFRFASNCDFSIN